MYLPAWLKMLGERQTEKYRWMRPMSRPLTRSGQYPKLQLVPHSLPLALTGGHVRLAAHLFTAVYSSRRTIDPDRLACFLL